MSEAVGLHHGRPASLIKCPGFYSCLCILGSNGWLRILGPYHSHLTPQKSATARERKGNQHAQPASLNVCQERGRGKNDSSPRCISLDLSLSTPSGRLSGSLPFNISARLNWLCFSENRVNYTAIKLNPNSKLRLVTHNMVPEGGLVQLSSPHN